MSKRFFWMMSVLTVLTLLVAACGGAAQQAANDAQKAADEAKEQVDKAAEEAKKAADEAKEQVDKAAEEANKAADEAKEQVDKAAEEAKKAAEEVKQEAEKAVATVVATEEAAATGGECDDALGCVTIAAGDPIRLASALVIAGPNETLGVDSQTGVEVAIKERGPVAGHEVELQPEDDGCSAEGGQTAATKIASDKASWR